MSEATGDTTPTRLILIRHGESRTTVDRVIGGPRTCSGLSDLGRRQTERLRDRLAESGPGLVVPTASSALTVAAASRPDDTSESVDRFLAAWRFSRLRFVSLRFDRAFDLGQIFGLGRFHRRRRLSPFE